MDQPVQRDPQRTRVLKNKLRAAFRTVERAVVDRFFAYGDDELRRALSRIGIEPGDSVLLHAAFEPRHGFKGSIEDLTRVFLESVGPQGTLLMVSLPYRSAALDYLAKGKVFDVRRTPSAMGLISEFFRRREGVLRSLHPTHPILALGPNAEWFVERHEECMYPCGPGTPFEKLLRCGGKVAFFNVPFPVFTFFHYLEHMVRDEVPFPIYDDASFEVPVIDRNGARRTVKTLAFARDAIQRRRPEILESWLSRHGVIKRTRVGASTLMLVDLAEVEGAVKEMMKDGVLFYDLSVPAVAGGFDDPR